MTDTHSSADQLFPVRAEFAARAHVDQTSYRARYTQAAHDPDTYWLAEARQIGRAHV